MNFIFAALCALGLGACDRNETIANYGAAERVWKLIELDGTVFLQQATLGFPEPGQIAGQAPCNRYFGSMTAPYPWFEANQIGSTRKACPDLGAETAFLTALGEMTQSEVSGNFLILRNEQGREMVFQASR